MHNMTNPAASPAPSPEGDGADGDTALLGRIQRGDHAAFALLVRRHATRYHRLAFRYLRETQEAEDIVQESFLRLWERPAMWNEEKGTKFTTWFHRVVVNHCLDRLRRKKPIADIDLPEVEDGAERADDQLARQATRTALKREMGKLPERQKTALILSFEEGLSNQEASEVMGVGLKAFQSLLMRAKATLKITMQPYR